jgi:AcrR family transcriptional regulator
MTMTADQAAEPGAPPRGRAERTAGRLREAARAAFAELGWNATRVEDIVRRAGVSHGTFYTYYENKSALLRDLVRTSQDDLATLAAAPWRGDDVRGAIEQVIGGVLDLFARDAVVVKTWLQAAREDDTFGDLYVASRALFVSRVAEHLEAAAAISGRSAPSARTVAASLVAMVEHFAYLWLVLGEPHDRDDAIAALVLVWGSALNELADAKLVAV